MNLQEAIEEAKAQINQADYLLETTSGVYKTGLQKVYSNKSELLRVLVLHAQCAELQSKIDSGELVEVVHGNWNISKEYMQCSSCDTAYEVDMYSPICAETAMYCPHCGAKMDGGKV